MTYHEYVATNKDFKNRTLTRADYNKALRAMRVKMQPETYRKHRNIDDSALTLAIRCFGSVEGKRIWGQTMDAKRKRGQFKKSRSIF